MKNLYLLVAIAVMFNVNLTAQVPCVDGMAGDYPCCGYDLQSNITLDELGVEGQGNDIWGWVDPMDGSEYALVGGQNRATFVDITDPINPVFVGYMETQTNPSTWRDIKVFNNHAFIVSEASNHGMQVFDLTRLRDVVDPPIEFEPDAWLGDMGAAHNIVINEESGFAYAVGADTFNGGPSFIDINDPLNPVTVGGYDGDGSTHDAQVVNYSGPDAEHTDKEIFFGFNGNSLTIVDVTDKTDPIQMSRTEYINTGFAHQGWLDDEQTLIYLGDETDEGTFDFNTRTVIFDVSDLESPILLEEYFGETPATDHNMYVLGDKIYQSNYSSGMRVLQINDDPDNRLEEIGYFDVFPEHNNNGFQGTWSLFPYYPSGNVVISSRDEGLFVVIASEEGNCFVGVDEYEIELFSIYPNPVQDELTIRMKAGEILEQVSVSDVVGREVYLETGIDLAGNTYPMNFSNLSPGAYFMTINKTGKAQRFIVE